MKLNMSIMLSMLLIVFAFPAISEEKSAFAPVKPLTIEGSFLGEVTDKGELYPIITTFIKQENGEIHGKYSLGEGKDIIVGSLTNMKQESDYSALFTWTDEEGTGFFRVIFSADHRTFYGFWGIKEDMTYWSWTGTKQ